MSSASASAASYSLRASSSSEDPPSLSASQSGQPESENIISVALASRFAKKTEQKNIVGVDISHCNINMTPYHALYRTFPLVPWLDPGTFFDFSAVHCNTHNALGHERIVPASGDRKIRAVDHYTSEWLVLSLLMYLTVWRKCRPAWPAWPAWIQKGSANLPNPISGSGTEL